MVREFTTELAFSLVLVLIAEVVVRVLGWDRLWALVTVFALGHSARAVLTRRRRTVLLRSDEAARLPR